MLLLRLHLTDLYLFFKGPFWICATLVVTIAISGNLANYLIHAGDHNWAYDFHKSKSGNTATCDTVKSYEDEILTRLFLKVICCMYSITVITISFERVTFEILKIPVSIELNIPIKSSIQIKE